MSKQSFDVSRDQPILDKPRKWVQCPFSQVRRCSILGVGSKNESQKHFQKIIIRCIHLFFREPLFNVKKIIGRVQFLMPKKLFAR